MRNQAIGDSGLGVAAEWAQAPGARHMLPMLRRTGQLRRRRRHSRRHRMFAGRSFGLIPVATPEALGLGDVWSGTMGDNLSGLGKKLHFKLPKLKVPKIKGLGKVVKYAAIAAAAYYTGGAALPLLKKIGTKIKTARGGGDRVIVGSTADGSPIYDDGSVGGQVIDQLTGLITDAASGAVIGRVPPAPGSVDYYGKGSPSPYGSPYGSPYDFGGAPGAFDPYGQLKDQGYMFAMQDQGEGAGGREPQRAGILGMSPRTLMIVAGVGALAFIVSRRPASSGRRRR